MKIFVLVQGESGGMTDRAYLHGVYSSREKANDRWDDLRKESDIWIEELELDDSPKAIRIV